MTMLGIWLGLSGGTAFGYSSVVAFGDSLSDNGNIGRFTDGALWVESLADHYSATLYDFAYVGATTGYDNPVASLPITGLQWQVEKFSPLIGSLAPADTLLTVWAGANDYVQGRDYKQAALNIGIALENLYGAGGRNFLVPNLPDMGNIPAYYGIPAASCWTAGFNSNLDGLLQGFGTIHDDINLYFVDIFSVFQQYPAGSPEWLSIFWIDGFHPSSVGHELIFQAAKEAADPVPEPATMILFGTGVLGIIGSRSRKK
jgi:phospholipase/lecithinase/hemolysin